MPQSPSEPSRSRLIGRAALEIAFILFLFYANLLMGEFEASNGRGKTIAFALHDICTGKNLSIALVAAVVGFAAFSALRHLLRTNPR